MLTKIKPLFPHVISSFLIGVVFCFLTIQIANAGTNITWDDGAGDNLWETGTNWSGNAVPTADDQVTIDNDTVTLSSGQTASFSSLTIGSGTNFTELILTGNLGTAGSTTIANNARLTQKNNILQTVTSTINILSGGILRATSNTTELAYAVRFTADNIYLASGGSVDVDRGGVYWWWRRQR